MGAKRIVRAHSFRLVRWGLSPCYSTRLEVELASIISKIIGFAELLAVWVLIDTGVRSEVSKRGGNCRGPSGGLPSGICVGCKLHNSFYFFGARHDLAIRPV